MPIFCPEKDRCLHIISAAYIQVHFVLNLMEANDLSHDQSAPRELSNTTIICYLCTKVDERADNKSRDRQK